MKPAVGYLLVKQLEKAEKVGSIYVAESAKKDIAKVEVVEAGMVPYDNQGNQFKGYDTWGAGTKLITKKASLIDLENGEKLFMLRFFDVLAAE